LLAALDQQCPLPPNHKEYGRTVLPISAEEFWDFFLDGKYAFENYYTEKGCKPLEITQKWTNNIDEPNFKKGFNGRDVALMK